MRQGGACVSEIWWDRSSQHNIHAHAGGQATQLIKVHRRIECRCNPRAHCGQLCEAIRVLGAMVTLHTAVPLDRNLTGHSGHQKPVQGGCGRAATILYLCVQWILERRPDLVAVSSEGIEDEVYEHLCGVHWKRPPFSWKVTWTWGVNFSCTFITIIYLSDRNVHYVLPIFQPAAFPDMLL